MQTKTNEISLTFDYEAIEDKYDFYQIKTSAKYISGGAKVLDLIDCPVKALSICFDNGTSAFAMFNKYSIKLNEMQKSIDDPTISVRKIKAKELKPYILGRLFLYSMNNSDFDDFTFNNLTGKLYLFLPNKNNKHVKALQIEINIQDNVMRLDATATTFTRTDAFKNQALLKAFPKYTFSVHGTMKRCLDENAKGLYVRKSPSNTKTRISFLEFSEKHIKQSKVYMLFKTVDAYNQKFADLSNISFNSKDISKRVTSKKDQDFFDSVLICLKDKTLNFVNMDETLEDAIVFDNLVSRISSFVPYSDVKVSNDIRDGDLKVVLIHNEDYYKQNNIDDPYKKFKRNQVIQCVTTEDAALKDDEIILKTILKELAIKNDIISERHITLDDWQSFGFEGKWIFGMSKDDISYFLEVKPDGAFITVHPSGPFKEFQTDEYRDLDYILQSSKGKGKTLIADDKGNVNVISCTGLFTLPEKDILINPSRSKSSVDTNMAGLSGINVYEIDENNVMYNVGAFDKGMRSSLADASLIYNCSVIKGRNLIAELMETMSVLFVKWNSYTVLPYPIKYLREYIEMETANTKK